MNTNGITIPTRLVERVVLAALVLAVGGETIMSSTEAPLASLETGRDAIRNACEFDNSRTQELRTNLQLFLEDHRDLHARVFPGGHDNNITAIQSSIDALSFRNCSAAADTLKGQ